MPNLMFTLWMLLFPVAAAVRRHLDAARRARPSDSAGRALSAFFEVVTWLGVGYLLYGT